MLFKGASNEVLTCICDVRPGQDIVSPHQSVGIYYVLTWVQLVILKQFCKCIQEDLAIFGNTDYGAKYGESNLMSSTRKRIPFGYSDSPSLVGIKTIFRYRRKK